ncbi:hypothetical protein AMATHDRAFT_11462 [Amanita thiersii Skay4041]|uniref:Uncharacterized protein n=1 Tax=Amanita thiersii Skay4041 TaxID=703135 RepID=A0A2A9N906_9AGAR|nr:hypothetical protein AMATHDRAFT_11462 [Amanita thiersii Skay4041]
MDPLIFTLLPFYYLFQIIFLPFWMMVGSRTGGSLEPGWTLEQAFAQIQQLLSVVNTLQQMIVQQDQTIAQLQVQSMATPPAQPSIPRGPKIATLLFYNRSIVRSSLGFTNTTIHQLLKHHSEDEKKKEVELGMEMRLL